MTRTRKPETAESFIARVEKGLGVPVTSIPNMDIEEAMNQYGCAWCYGRKDEHGEFLDRIWLIDHIGQDWEDGTDVYARVVFVQRSDEMPSADVDATGDLPKELTGDRINQPEYAAARHEHNAF